MDKKPVFNNFVIPKMTELIPLFQLNIVVFPEEQLNLHIFEPRYKKLIKDSWEGSRRFGMPAVIGNTQVYGTELEIISIVKTHANGEMDIVTKGKRVFEIRDYYPAAVSDDYDRGNVEFQPIHSSEDPTVRTKVLDLFDQFMESVNDVAPPLKDNPYLSFKIGHHLALHKEQELELLKLQKETERQAFELEHLKKMVPLMEEMDMLKKRIQMNGHFQKLSLDN